ncbi:DNA-processing protein DprA [Bowmanella denitrificans]|uniref:DNA-processing protein DprA n=1 Tax=Bowmanella denitrificans TaxID=366582 RepID=A0ABN0XUR9_9ALTE
MTNEDNMMAWLTLDQMSGLSGELLIKLLQDTGGHLPLLLQWDAKQLRRCGLHEEQIRQLKNPNQRWIADSLDWLSKDAQHFLLPLSDKRYPNQLRQLSRPPLLLFGKGQADILDCPQLAIVGSRSPSSSGQQSAFELAGQLSLAGLIVTSGLALGIDGWAHKGALKVNGKTIAVLGSGLANVYPRRHLALANQISECGGCLLSEFAPGQSALPEHFPRRNRIISGLSLGTLVVEAALRSGSLITARYALEQGRDVFAVPGNIYNPLTEGCHYLIKQGAKLVTAVEDILEEYQNLALEVQNQGHPSSEKSSGNGLAKDPLLVSVEFEVTSIDVIAQRSGMPVTQVLAQLLEYELRGLVAAVPGGYVKLRGK